MRPLLIISPLGCFIRACGGGDSISADEADRIASELAQKTQALSSDVADAGRALAEDPDRADEARDRLRNLEDQAQDLAGQVEDLPETTDARKQLREANERIQDAAHAGGNSRSLSSLGEPAAAFAGGVNRRSRAR